MNNIKKSIIVILVIIIILAIIIISILKKYEDKPHEEFSMPYGDERIIQKEITRVNKNIDYYSIKLIAQSYLESIISQDTDTLYNILDLDTMKQENINKDDIITKLDNTIIKEDNDIEHYRFIIEDMYLSESDGNIVTYFVYVKVINSKSEKVMSTSFMVETDIENDTYYILPYEYMYNKGYLNIEEGKEYKTNITKIENNSYNEIEYDEPDEYTIILNLMSKLTDELVYDLDNSYNLFSDEYKKAKFDTLDEYKKYMKKNIRYIISSSIEKYQINEFDEYTEYICIDQYGNYYIFKETGVMNYTLQLDTYTIDSQEFIEKYNKGSEQLKVGMNLEKIFQALNRKDYEYIYKKLHNTFKTNNFPTLQSFEDYMEENFFDMNKIDYGKFEEKSGVYIYEVNITDATEIEENTIEKSFIVQLNEGTDFAISFNK